MRNEADSKHNAQKFKTSKLGIHGAELPKFYESQKTYVDWSQNLNLSNKIDNNGKRFLKNE